MTTRQEPQTDMISRRTLLNAGVAGYALAVSPVSAWAITTPSANLITADITIPVGKEKMPAFTAAPKGKGPFPCVIVVQEIFGIHEYIRDVCRRLASEGYFAIAPSLYFRQGDATKYTDIKKLIAELVSKVPQAQVLGDLDETVKWLGGQKQVNAKRLGITGYCWGGNVTWMFSAHNPAIRAGVAWYGRVDGERNPLQPKFPLDIAGQLKTPVLGLYGEKDQGIPIADIEKIRKELAKGTSKSQINVYAGAEHGFHADYRPSYQEKAAKEGWTALLAWFKENLA